MLMMEGRHGSIPWSARERREVRILLTMVANRIALSDPPSRFESYTLAVENRVYSTVAQRQSKRLLTARSLVRSQPVEPIRGCKLTGKLLALQAGIEGSSPSNSTKLWYWSRPRLRSAKSQDDVPVEPTT